MNNTANKQNSFDYGGGRRQLSHWILWLTLAFILIAVFWAKSAVLDEVTVARGKVDPVKLCSSCTGGIISQINVQEGDIVKKG